MFIMLRHLALIFLFFCIILREDKNLDGKIRKYYTKTEKGDIVLIEARKKAYELFKEIKD